jgi:hypothetical protein
MPALMKPYLGLAAIMNSSYYSSRQGISFADRSIVMIPCLSNGFAEGFVGVALVRSTAATELNPFTSSMLCICKKSASKGLPLGERAR